MVPRAKKPKHPQKAAFEVVKQSNYLSLAITVRTLHAMGQDIDFLNDFTDSYLVLMQEVADKRNTVKNAIRDCETLTGINVEELLKNVLEIKR